MCRSIKTLRRLEPPASEEDVRAAALQFVRKISGYRAPSQANQSVFDEAVDEIAEASRRLLDGLVVPVGSRSPGGRRDGGEHRHPHPNAHPRHGHDAAPLLETPTLKTVR